MTCGVATDIPDILEPSPKDAFRAIDCVAVTVAMLDQHPRGLGPEPQPILLLTS